MAHVSYWHGKGTKKLMSHFCRVSTYSICIYVPNGGTVNGFRPLRRQEQLPRFLPSTVSGNNELNQQTVQRQVHRFKRSPVTAFQSTVSTSKAWIKCQLLAVYEGIDDSCHISTPEKIRNKRETNWTTISNSRSPKSIGKWNQWTDRCSVGERWSKDSHTSDLLLYISITEKNTYVNNTDVRSVSYLTKLFNETGYVVWNRKMYVWKVKWERWAKGRGIFQVTVLGLK
jgi:hypothetical protein